MRPSREKIKFYLKRDSDGYPPVDTEWVWAEKIDDGSYKIDNIPFFVRKLAAGDIVGVIRSPDGTLIYERHLGHSKHSTIRILVWNVEDLPQLVAKLEELGCSWEQSHIDTLVSVDIPPKIYGEELKGYLEDGERRQLWEVEEAAIWDD